MKRIIKINHAPGKRASHYELYDVTLQDGDKQWNAHLNKNDFAAQQSKEDIAAALHHWNDIGSEAASNIINESVEKLEDLAYQRGTQDEAESHAGPEL